MVMAGIELVHTDHSTMEKFAAGTGGINFGKTSVLPSLSGSAGAADQWAPFARRV